MTSNSPWTMTKNTVLTTKIPVWLNWFLWIGGRERKREKNKLVRKNKKERKMENMKKSGKNVSLFLPSLFNTGKMLQAIHSFLPLPLSLSLFSFSFFFSFPSFSFFFLSSPSLTINFYQKKTSAEKRWFCEWMEWRDGHFFPTIFFLLISSSSLSFFLLPLSPETGNKRLLSFSSSRSMSNDRWIENPLIMIRRKIPLTWKGWTFSQRKKARGSRRAKGNKKSARLPEAHWWQPKNWEGSPEAWESGIEDILTNGQSVTSYILNWIFSWKRMPCLRTTLPIRLIRYKDKKFHKFSGFEMWLIRIFGSTVWIHIFTTFRIQVEERKKWE